MLTTKVVERSQQEMDIKNCGLLTSKRTWSNEIFEMPSKI